MTRIDSISQAGREQWLQVCNESSTATFFHTPYWYESWASAIGTPEDATALRILFDDGAVAIIPFLRQRVLFGIQALYHSSPAGNYGGFISTNSLSEEHKDLLLKVMKNRRNIVIRENPFDPFPRSIPFSSSADDFTQVVDLSRGFEDAYSRWSRGHVNAVNKARRAGIIVERATSRADWETHYALYLELRKKWSDPHGRAYPWKLFQMLHDIQSHGVTMWVARHEGHIVSSTICLEWNQHVAAWHAAVSSAKLPVRPNHLMYYEIIAHTAAQNRRWFDFNPSGGIEGVVSFKKHFGTTTLQSRVLKKFSPILRARVLLGKMVADRNKRS